MVVKFHMKESVPNFTYIGATIRVQDPKLLLLQLVYSPLDFISDHPIEPAPER